MLHLEAEAKISFFLANTQNHNLVQKVSPLGGWDK